MYRSLPRTMVAGTLLLLAILMGCGHETLLIPAGGSENRKTAAGNGGWLSVKDALALHNGLMISAQQDFISLDQFLGELPDWLDDRLPEFLGDKSSWGDEVVAWLEQQPLTPNDLIRPDNDQIKAEWQAQMEAYSEKGLLTPEAVTSVQDILARFETGDLDLGPLQSWVRSVETTGTPAEQQLAGVMLGSAMFWKSLPTTPRPGREIKAFTGSLVDFLMGFMVDSLWAASGGIIGTILGFVGSFVWWLAMYAEDNLEQEGDYPHWGVHH